MNKLLKSIAIAVLSGLVSLSFLPGAQAEGYGAPGAAAAGGAQGSVSITAPKDGSEVAAGQPVEVKYSVKPGPHGNHVHLYVDGKQTEVLRKLKGSYTLKDLTPGKHSIAIKVVDAGHTPTGVEGSVSVTVK
jgi:Big-like domain-containing protein